MAGERNMSELRHALTEYLSLRRSLGYKLRRQEKLLHQFIDFLASTGAPTITVQHVLPFAVKEPGVFGVMAPEKG